MRHYASARFWKAYRGLPESVQGLADRNYELLKSDPAHRSLRFKKVGSIWSVRIGLHYRALATEAGGDFVWFWIGSHAEYDKLVGRKPAVKPLQPTSRGRGTAKSKRRDRPARD